MSDATDQEGYRRIAELVDRRDRFDELARELAARSNQIGFLITRWERFDTWQERVSWLHDAFDPVALALKAIEKAAEHLLKKKLSPEEMKSVTTVKEAASIGKDIAKLLMAFTPVGAADAALTVGLSGAAIVSNERQSQLKRKMDQLWERSKLAAKKTAAAKGALDQEIGRLRIG